MDAMSAAARTLAQFAVDLEYEAIPNAASPRWCRTPLFD
jgi:hypothetical protein